MGLMHVASIPCMTVLLGKFPRYQSPRPQIDLVHAKKAASSVSSSGTGQGERRA